MMISPARSAASSFDFSDPCHDCSVACCRAFRIYLTSFDLQRIVLTLGVAAADICLPVQCAGENLDHRHLSFSLGEEERFLLALRRNRRGCLFLMKIGATQRCGIHQVRPLVCRSYPLIASGRHLMMARQALCPSPWVLSSAHRKDFQNLQKQRERESFLFQAVLERWHDEGLPALRASGIPVHAFQARFHVFLDFVLQLEIER